MNSSNTDTMLETLELKEICYNEVSHLSLTDALKKRITDSILSAEIFFSELKNEKELNKNNILPELSE